MMSAAQFAGCLVGLNSILEEANCLTQSRAHLFLEYHLRILPQAIPLGRLQLGGPSYRKI